MSTQLALAYDPEIRAAERGKALAASAHYRDLALAREIALELAQGGNVICADQVRLETLRRWPDIAWGNWAGSLFAGPRWRSVGFTRSRVDGSHGNLLRTWRTTHA